MTTPFTDYPFQGSPQNEALTMDFEPEQEERASSGFGQADSFEEPYFYEDEWPAGEQENGFEFDMPTPGQDITDALNKKDWKKALQLALRDCRFTEGELTNLLFFARHPELAKESLKPGQPNFAPLSREWKKIWINEVRPFMANGDLQVPVKYVFERDKEFAGDTGARFQKMVREVAADVDLDPGFLAAVLLAETARNSYLTSGEVSSFETGTDNFFASQAQLRANVPAFSRIRFRRAGTDTNEHNNVVISVFYQTGRDAALATAVYLKNAEIKLRKGAQKNGGDFDTFPLETRLALTRIAMAAGHGGIQPDGEFSWFRIKAGKTVPAKKGDAGSFLVGVAKELARVLNGEDIFIRVNEDRKDPTNSRRVTLRNATILVAQALHLSACFFGQAPAAQPETESLEDGQVYEEWLDTERETGPFHQGLLLKATLFMTITGEKQGMIKGSVTAKGKEGAIEVFQFRHELVSPADVSSGAATGKRKHPPLVIVKGVDGASVQLMNALVTNERLKQVVINFWRSSANGAAENFYRIQLTNARVAGILQKTAEETDDKNHPLLERLELAYQKIEWLYLPAGLSAMDDVFMAEAVPITVSEETPPEDEASLYENEETAFENFIPAISVPDRRKRLDRYLANCNFSYRLPDGTTINAVPQFRMTNGFGLKSEDAKVKVKRSLAGLGKSCKATGSMIHYAAYGRARPSELALITQCLIDAGEFDTMKKQLPASATPSQIVRRMQFEFGIGIDCAGYVQNAFAFMAFEKDKLSAGERESLGLKKAIGDERLESLPSSHFQKLPISEAQTGDLIVMNPRKQGDGSLHTVIVVEHIVNKDVHSFLVDSSWGHLYGDDVSGIARRTLMFDSHTNTWWDIHPVTLKPVNENSTGPYNGHSVKGVYRARPLKPKTVKEVDSDTGLERFASYARDENEMQPAEVQDGAGFVPEFEYD